jgi:hypothetical protein
MVAQPLFGTYRQRLIIFGDLSHLALCLSVGQFVSKCASFFRTPTPMLRFANFGHRSMAAPAGELIAIDAKHKKTNG